MAESSVFCVTVHGKKKSLGLIFAFVGLNLPPKNTRTFIASPGKFHSLLYHTLRKSKLALYWDVTMPVFG
jgi:hypothetical protein